MSRGPRSKVASAAKSNDDTINDEDYDNVEDRSSTSYQSISRKSPSDLNSLPLGSTIQGSNILHHNFGPLYPIPQSLKSPQIMAFQNGLSLMANRIFTNASDMSQWYDELMAQASLINMNEFFQGQIKFQIHPACDALYHIKNATTTSPFNMKSVEDNIAFLEYTSPSSITVPADTSYYADHKTTVYVTKKQLDVVDYVSKFTGHYLKSLLSKPGNTTYLRLIITINYKIDVDQVVPMLDSLYRHAVTNQKGTGHSLFM